MTRKDGLSPAGKVRRIGFAPRFRDELRQHLDKEFAERPQSDASQAEPASQRVHWTCLEALSWILYRDPERVGAIRQRDVRGMAWYDVAFQSCSKEFRRAGELGHLVGFRRGVSMAPAEWVNLDWRKDPSIVFTAAAVVELWPSRGAKIEDVPTKPPTLGGFKSHEGADLNVGIIRSPDKYIDRWSRLIAKQVILDDQQHPAVPVDDLTDEQVRSLSPKEQQDREKRRDRLNGMGKEGVIARIQKTDSALLQDDGERAWDELFVDDGSKSKGRRGRIPQAVSKNRVVIAEKYLQPQR